MKTSIFNQQNKSMIKLALFSGITMREVYLTKWMVSD